MLKDVITDTMIHARVKLVNIVFNGGVLLIDKIIAMLWNATSNFLDHIKEIFVIIVLMNFTPFIRGNLTQFVELQTFLLLFMATFHHREFSERLVPA